MDEKEELLSGLREKEGYREMRVMVENIVSSAGLLPDMELEEIREKLIHVLDPEDRDVVLEDLQFRLTNAVMRRVTDKDSMSSDESVFMMIMIEDICKHLILEKVENAEQ